jgi:hypothetical protein
MPRVDFHYWTGENYILELPSAHRDPREVLDDSCPDDGWVGYLEADRADLLGQLYSAIFRITDHAPFVGGDDEYFDYFPENFFILDEVVKVLENEILTDAVERAREWAYLVNYSALEPEAIGVEEGDIAPNEELFKAAEVLRVGKIQYRLRG